MRLDLNTPSLANTELKGCKNSCKYRTEGGAKIIATELKGCKNPCNITEGVAKIFYTRAEGVAKIHATELKGLQKTL